jgi:hypothetical protein
VIHARKLLASWDYGPWDPNDVPRVLKTVEVEKAEITEKGVDELEACANAHRQ